MLELQVYDVVVIGAGPYGLSPAAHLRAAGIKHQVFGRPMEAWRSHMPKGMWLNSDGFASNRSDPAREFPLHFLPANARREIARKRVGSAASRRMREQVVPRIPVLTARHLVAASVKDGRIELNLQAEDQGRQVECVDRVVAATGYRIDLSRPKFSTAGFRAKIACSAGAPRLSTRFESSVSGLYFVGPSAADSFGPLTRFGFGAEFAARQVAATLPRQYSAVAQARAQMARSRAPAIPAP